MAKRKLSFWIYYISFAIGLFGGLFLCCPKSVFAADAEIVISEVMVNPASHNDLCSNDSCEWIEIFNIGQEPVNLLGWVIDEKTIPTSIIVLPDDFLIVTKNKSSFLSIWQIDQSKVLELAISLANSRLDNLRITNADLSYVEEFTWDAPAGEDISWEKINLTGGSSANWRASLLGGTPGKKPVQDDLPDYPGEVTDLININSAVVQTVEVSRIIDGDTVEVTGIENFPDTIRLIGIDAAESGQALFGPAKTFTSQLLGETVDLLISREPTHQIDPYNRTLAAVVTGDEIFNVKLLRAGLAIFYESTNPIIKTDSWIVFEDEAKDEKLGVWASSSGRNILISEILPDPEGDDGTGEWIELFNSYNGEINLSYYKLDNYVFPIGTTIGANGFLVLNRQETDITLNNTGDSVKLYFPDGIVADESSYGRAKAGESWALVNGSWVWTVELTPGNQNIYTDSEATGGDDELEIEENIPINQVAIGIKTGDYQNYENYLVTVTGTIVETSGNTFYLDDGSGRAKVYIQAATNIDKPEMHKGDIFEVTGIVNLYRNTWRILPQTQDDIKLIEKKNVVSVASTVKKASAASKSSTTKKTTSSNAQARAPTNKQIAASEDVKVAAAKSPWWVQVIKMILGITVILFILIIIKIVRTPKIKPIGGDFGDET